MPEFPNFYCGGCNQGRRFWRTATGSKVCTYCGWTVEDQPRMVGLEQRVAKIEEWCVEEKRRQTERKLERAAKLEIQMQHEYEMELALQRRHKSTVGESLAMYHSKELLAELQRRQDGGA